MYQLNGGGGGGGRGGRGRGGGGGGGGGGRKDWKADLHRQRKEVEEKAKAAKQEKMDIINKIGATVSERLAKADLVDMRFYVIEVHTWYLNEVGAKYDSPPAEIGIVEMSLAKGVCRTFHRLIHHGEIPLGLRADMVTKARKLHKIPIGHECLAEDYGKIVEDLVKFLNKPSSVTRFGGGAEEEEEGDVVAFVMPDREVGVRKALDLLVANAGGLDEGGSRLGLRLFPLPQLLFDMSKGFLSPDEQETSCPSILMAEGILEDTIKYFYAPGISCPDYHADLDYENGDCALAAAKMRAFLLCNHLCPLLPEAIELIPGRHVPPVNPDKTRYKV